MNKKIGFIFCLFVPASLFGSMRTGSDLGRGSRIVTLDSVRSASSSSVPVVMPSDDERVQALEQFLDSADRFLIQLPSEQEQAHINEVLGTTIDFTQGATKSYMAIALAVAEKCREIKLHAPHHRTAAVDGAGAISSDLARLTGAIATERATAAREVKSEHERSQTELEKARQELAATCQKLTEVREAFTTMAKLHVKENVSHAKELAIATENIRILEEERRQQAQIIQDLIAAAEDRIKRAGK